MHRMLIIIAAGAVVVAAAALALVALKGRPQSNADAAGTAVVPVTEETPEVAPAESAHPNGPTAPSPAERRAPRIVVARNPKVDQPNETPSALNAKIIEAETANGLRPAASVARQKDMLRLSLPSSRMVDRLAGAVDSSLKLSDSQLAAAAEIEEEMKTDIEQSLRNHWAQRDALRAQMKLYNRRNDAEKLIDTQQTYQDLFEAERDVREKLNAKYAERFAEVLNPDQMEYLTGPMTPEMKERLYGPDILEERNPTTDPTLTDPVQVRIRYHQEQNQDGE